LFAAKTEPVDPVRRHRVEVGRIGVSLLAAHKVGRRIWQGFIELTKIGKNEVLDLPGAPRLVQSVSRCIYTRYADDITFSSYQPLTPLFEGPRRRPGISRPIYSRIGFAELSGPTASRSIRRRFTTPTSIRVEL
jgi:hypothetical protein